MQADVATLEGIRAKGITAKSGGLEQIGARLNQALGLRSVCKAGTLDTAKALQQIVDLYEVASSEVDRKAALKARMTARKEERRASTDGTNPAPKPSNVTELNASFQDELASRLQQVRVESIGEPPNIVPAGNPTLVLRLQKAEASTPAVRKGSVVSSRNDLILPW